jgi:hypothetical protein
MTGIDLRNSAQDRLERYLAEAAASSGCTHQRRLRDFIQESSSDSQREGRIPMIQTGCSFGLERASVEHADTMNALLAVFDINSDA